MDNHQSPKPGQTKPRNKTINQATLQGYKRDRWFRDHCWASSCSTGRAPSMQQCRQEDATLFKQREVRVMADAKSKSLTPHSPTGNADGFMGMIPCRACQRFKGRKPLSVGY